MPENHVCLFFSIFKEKKLSLKKGHFFQINFKINVKLFLCAILLSKISLIVVCNKKAILTQFKDPIMTIL